MNAITTTLATIACALLLASCTTYPVPQVMGGSASGAMVEVGFEYGDMERPKPDWMQGNQNATDACRRWGYEKATPTGGERNQCIAHSGYYAGGIQYGAMGCSRMRVVVVFQCIGTADTRTPIE